MNQSKRKQNKKKIFQLSLLKLVIRILRIVLIRALKSFFFHCDS